MCVLQDKNRNIAWRKLPTSVTSDGGLGTIIGTKLHAMEFRLDPVEFDLQIRLDSLSLFTLRSIYVTSLSRRYRLLGRKVPRDVKPRKGAPHEF